MPYKRTPLSDVPLPEDLRAEAGEKIAREFSGSEADYVAKLVLDDLRRDTFIEKVDSLLIEGLDSGDPIPVTDGWWKERRAALERHRS